MKKSLVSKLLLVIMAIMILSSTFMMSAFATNVDTFFSYCLTGGESYKTPFRDKDNYSSAYMKCTNTSTLSSSYVAAVYGGPRNAGAIDCSQGYYYYFANGYARFMYNNVKERGFPVAGILATTQNNGTIANGVWSPDSVPQSGVRPATDYIK